MKNRVGASVTANTPGHSARKTQTTRDEMPVGIRRTDSITILVTGSRDWEDPAFIEMLLDRYAAGRQVRLVHGAARGADMMADAIGRRRGWVVKAYPADWKRYGARAGPIRNQQMIDTEAPDVVIAFPKEASRGTYDCMQRAKKAGIKIAICVGAFSIPDTIRPTVEEEE